MQSQSIKKKQSVINFQTTNVLAKSELLKLKGGNDGKEIIIEEELGG